MQNAINKVRIALDNEIRLQKLRSLSTKEFQTMFVELFDETAAAQKAERFDERADGTRLHSSLSL